MCLALVGTARGQFADDFSDGDFTTNPPWLATDTLWSIVVYEADFALQTNGAAISDTLTAATASSTAYGSWSFTFAYTGGRLSNFNQVRFFVASDSPDLTAPISGYHVQFGTNSRDVRLYRSDPGVSGDRELLAASATDLLSQDDDTLSVTIQRATDNTWNVLVDGASVLIHQESNPPPLSATHFGLWVKHSATRGSGYLFDDFVVVSDEPTDTIPPQLVEAVYEAGNAAVLVRFNEEIDPQSVQVAGFSVSDGVGTPSAATVINESGRPEGSTAQLTFVDTIPPGTYSIAVSGVSDVAGNVMQTDSASLEVEGDIVPPDLVTAAATTGTDLTLTFSEPISSGGSCSQTANYEITPGARNPTSITCPSVGGETVELAFEPALEAGAYTVTVASIEDVNGNVATNLSAPFTISLAASEPQPGDIVINEIHYAPSDPALEFIELLNVSDNTFDLADLEIADSRRSPVPISAGPVAVLPDAYVVLVRDESAFAAAFGQTSAAIAIEVPSWPALNNGGDSPTLLYGVGQAGSGSGGTAIDSVAYVSSWGGAGVSLERIDPAGPSNSASNWAPSVASAGGTPGERNSVYAPDVTAPQIRFAEQRDGTHVRVYFFEPVLESSVRPQAFLVNGTVPDGAITGPDGSTVDLSVSAGLAAGSVTVDGVSDLTGNVIEDAVAPIAMLPARGDLVVNEIMYAPRSDPQDGLPDQTEYVEIFNTSTRLLSLTSMYWTDHPDENGVSDTTRFGASPIGIRAGRYAVIFAEPDIVADDDIYTQSSIVQAFPQDYRGLEAALRPIAGSSLGLLNDGDLIKLHTRLGTPLDSVVYAPDWHNRLVRDDSGVSLERIDPLLGANLSSNWTTSAASSGGTPGATNSVYLASSEPGPEDGIVVEPSPFSPDYDGVDDVTAIRYALSSSAAAIRIRIFDSRGREVRTLEEARLSGSEGHVLWDGTDDAGNPLRIGIYVILLEALDEGGSKSEVHKAVAVVARPLG